MGRTYRELILLTSFYVLRFLALVKCLRIATRSKKIKREFQKKQIEAVRVVAHGSHCARQLKKVRQSERLCVDMLVMMFVTEMQRRILNYKVHYLAEVSLKFCIVIIQHKDISRLISEGNCKNPWKTGSYQYNYRIEKKEDFILLKLMHIKLVLHAS